VQVMVGPRSSFSREGEALWARAVTRGHEPLYAFTKQCGTAVPGFPWRPWRPGLAPVTVPGPYYAGYGPGTMDKTTPKYPPRSTSRAHPGPCWGTQPPRPPSVTSRDPTAPRGNGDVTSLHARARPHDASRGPEISRVGPRYRGFPW